MRIACLQFAPRTGDVDHNMSRADAVLSKADQSALDDIDMIVLPELAMTGSDFHSLKDISQYLEHSTSGITALWARTTALRYNATVAVGYPEKVDVTPNWPASPEYYNSVVVVNGDGETVANVRKRTLTSDKKWALQSREDGFVSAAIDGIGETMIGISTDLFTPSPDYNFALHAVDAESRVILVSMSWAAQSEARMFSRTPSEPDMDALTSWTQQLLPLIKTEGREEVIVVLCNRCGSEDGVAYSGTSAVLGIKDGEVFVYGLLGRGVKELLVVDTSAKPFAKLVQVDTASSSKSQDTQSVLHQSSGSEFKQSQLSPGLVRDRAWPSFASTSGTSTKSRVATPPRPTRQRTREGSPSPAATRASRAKSKIPMLSIPGHSIQATRATSTHDDVNRSFDDSGEATSPTVLTPTCPTPTCPSMRPQLVAKAAMSEDLLGHGTNQLAVRGQPGSVTTDLPLSPTTPFLEFFRNTSPSSPMSPFCFQTSPLHSPQAPRNQESQLYWVPPRQLLKSPTSTSMSPLDTPVDRVMSMFSVCAPTSLAAETNQSPCKSLVRQADQTPAHTAGSSSPNTQPSSKQLPTAESLSRARTRSTSRESAQPRPSSAAPNGKICDKATILQTTSSRVLSRPRSLSADITASSTLSRGTGPSMGTIQPRSQSVAPPFNQKVSSASPSTIITGTLPSGRSRPAVPGLASSAKRNHSNDSSSQNSPPFARPSNRATQSRNPLAHPRSRSLSGSQKRGRQGGSRDLLQRITFTPGHSVAQQINRDTYGGQCDAPFVPSPNSDGHPRGRMPEIPRPSSIPRQRQTTSSGFDFEIPRPSSIPRQRRGTSTQGELRRRAKRPEYDPNEIIATISKITADCPHHAVNRPMGPVVQSADGSLYTIELPRHVQDLAMSLLTKPLSDTRADSRQTLPGHSTTSSTFS